VPVWLKVKKGTGRSTASVNQKSVPIRTNVFITNGRITKIDTHLFVPFCGVCFLRYLKSHLAILATGECTVIRAPAPWLSNASPWAEGFWLPGYTLVVVH
jgi:hypothetical protein